MPDSTPPHEAYCNDTGLTISPEDPFDGKIRVAVLRKDPGTCGRNTKIQFMERFKFPLEKGYNGGEDSEIAVTCKVLCYRDGYVLGGPFRM